jgi:hypothetical protein
LVSDVAIKHVDDHFLDDMWIERNAVSLADSLHVAVCDQLDENEVASAVVGWWISNHECLDVRDFHVGISRFKADRARAQRGNQALSGRYEERLPTALRLGWTMLHRHTVTGRV